MTKGRTKKRAAGAISQSMPASEGRFVALDGLASFLNHEGNTLLIKGYAGAGKTTLALQLMKELAPDGSGLYVSSRVSQKKLHRELPWAEFGRGRRVTGGFTDLRLGSPSTFVEEILRAMPPKGRSRVLILDTWDGIAKELDKTERLKAEKMLIAIADSTKARMIFVSEEPERTTMDYLVDGMVEMKREEEYGRVFREIEVQKLRGTLIEQHKYLYTLLGGRFHLVPPYSRPPSSNAQSPPLVRRQDDCFSFGSPQLDEVFGGLRMGETFSLVYDERVPYSAIRLLSVSAVISALNAGRGVFGVPLPGSGVKGVAEMAKPFVSPEVYRDCLAVGTLGSDAELEVPLHPVTSAQQSETTARISDLIARVRNSSETKSVLVIESVGTFEGAFASNVESVLEGISARAATVRAGGTDGLLLLLQQDSPIASRVLALSASYARLLMKHGSAVIMGEKPRTPAYALEHSTENALVGQLTQIV